MLINRYTRRYHIFFVVTLLVVTTTVCCASATIREEAKQAVALLQQNESSHAFPNELKSVYTAFTYAEDFFYKGYSEIAERYYLLAVLKARILQSTLSSQPSDSLDSKIIVQQNSDSKHIPRDPSPAVIVLDVSPSENEPVRPQNVINLHVPTADTTASIDSYNHLADNVISEKLVGNADTYIVKSKDTLRLVAARLGVSRQLLMRMNNLHSNASLKIGQPLKYNNRKIIPQQMSNGIVINIPDRTLYYFRHGKIAISLPVALGVAKKSEKYDWTTPTGKFKIIAKQKDPTWTVPLSIQSEMEDAGKEVLTTVSPGPTNPLGKYAIKTSIPGILIHSTTRPSSIYSFASHGCIRVYPEHMEEFFKEIKVNTPGEIIYRTVKLALTEGGRIFLEVHKDAYGKSSNLSSEARLQIKKHNLTDRVDWNKVESVVKQQDGVAIDITL